MSGVRVVARFERGGIWNVGWSGIGTGGGGARQLIGEVFGRAGWFPVTGAYGAKSGKKWLGGGKRKCWAGAALDGAG